MADEILPDATMRATTPAPESPAGDAVERVKAAILAALDSDGEPVAWQPTFWTREKAAEFFANAAIASLAPPGDANEVQTVARVVLAELDCPSSGHFARIEESDIRVLARAVLSPACPHYSKPSEMHAPGWQPIETAPKDGRKIILGAVGDFDIYLCRWSEGGWQEDDGQFSPLYGVTPTHWRPRPAPPTP